MIIAIDFDGTVVDNCWPRIGEEVPGAVDALMALVVAGHDLVLWTCRCDAPLEDAVAWFADRGIPLAGVNESPRGVGISPKLSADLYIDDKCLGVPAVTPFGFRCQVVDWPKILEMLGQSPAQPWPSIRPHD